MKHPFEVGETYRNEKGEYEVLSIEPPTMEIRWADGSTWEGPIDLQTRILQRIEAEAEAARYRAEMRALREAQRADPRGRAFEGLVDTDFQTGITDTSWRRRENLGGLLAKMLSEETEGEFQSYTVYRQPLVYIVDPERYEQKIKERQPRLFIALDEEQATFGFTIDKSDGAMDDTWHWPTFLTALAGEAELLQRLEVAMRRLNLDWRVWYPEDERLDARVNAAVEGLVWAPQPKGDAKEMTWEAFVERLKAIPEDVYCELYLATDLPKKEAISAGANVTQPVIEVFRELAPLYEASMG